MPSSLAGPCLQLIDHAFELGEAAVLYLQVHEVAREVLGGGGVRWVVEEVGVGGVGLL